MKVNRRTIALFGLVLSTAGVAFALLAPGRAHAASRAGQTPHHRAASSVQDTDPGMPRDEGITQLPSTAQTQLPATPDTPRPAYGKPLSAMP